MAGMQRGVTYLWMLFLVFLLGLGLGKSLELYSTVMQREKEQELLLTGRLYRQAIEEYYRSSPGYLRKYPEKLEDLLRDPRYLSTRRYLRRLYPDPVSGLPFDVVASPEGGIMGVRSPSGKVPKKSSGFKVGEETFTAARSYQDWDFVAR